MRESISRSDIWYSGRRAIICPSSLNIITHIALCMRENSSLSRGRLCPAGRTRGRNTAASLYVTSLNTARGRRFMP